MMIKIQTDIHVHFKTRRKKIIFKTYQVKACTKTAIPVISTFIII